MLREATDWIKEQLEADPAAAKGAATDCQRMFGLTTIACLWADIVASIKDKQGDFYDNKRKLARFYMNHVLPETSALHRVITRGADSLAAFEVEDFDR